MTIRLRLTLLFTLLVAVMIGVFGLVSHRYASYARADAFETELWNRASTAATVALDSNELSDRALQPFRRELMRSLQDERVAVYNAACDTVYSLGGPMSGISREEFARTVMLERTTRMESDTQRVNLYYEDENHDYVVSVSAVDRKGRQSVGRLGNVLVGGWIGSVLIMFAIGWWFSGRAMAPVSGITRRAEEITATDLHVRIPEGRGRDELDRLAHAFNGMLNRLEAAFALQRQFIAHASHELRTPLTTLEGQLEVALMKLRSEIEYEAVLRNALDDTRHLRSLANNLLLLARSDTQFQDAPFESLRFDELVFAAVNEIHDRHPNRIIDVRFTVESDDETLLAMRGNGDLLRAALLNALDNAMKYSPHARPVVLLLAATPGAITLEIVNEGEGIPAGDLDKVFDLFYRAPSSAEIAGSGIGLTLIRTIVARHGGTVALESAPGATRLRLVFHTRETA